MSRFWRKLVINNGVNPLSALTGLDTRSLTHHLEFGKIVSIGPRLPFWFHNIARKYEMRYVR